MQKIQMIRVNKELRCPVCGKPDWCLIAADMTAAICPRIEAGSRKRCGDAGWLHVFDDYRRTQNEALRMKRTSSCQRQSARGQSVDFAKVAETCQQRCNDLRVMLLANSLGVTSRSLRQLGIGFSAGSYTFPMSDERGNIIGIRRRFEDGRKSGVTGSKNGLFIPAGIENAPQLVICEGPTDCAAALDLGYAAIGRPSCNSKVAMTVRYVRRRPVIIVADRDTAGIRGAQKLTDALLQNGSDVRIILPPLAYKDLRQWKESGVRINL